MQLPPRKENMRIKGTGKERREEMMATEISAKTPVVPKKAALIAILPKTVESTMLNLSTELTRSRGWRKMTDNHR